MIYQIPEQLKKLEPYQPISDQYRIRLDANESFLSLSTEILDQIAGAVREIAFNRYPDPNATKLRTGFASYYGVQPEHTVVGNGSDELINLIEETFLSNGDTILVADPDFSMYTVYARLLKLRVVTLKKSDGYNLDIEELLETAARENAKLIIFSNPCYPTGALLSRSQVRALVERTPALVVLDEAYMDFSDQSMIVEAHRHSNLIVLRTLSKAFACAACRLGFAVASKPLADVLRAAKSPYNVNTVSQTIGEILFANPAFIRSAIEKVLLAREFLYEKLSQIETVMGKPFHALPTATNFVFAESAAADLIDERLRAQGICVRKFPERLRISAGSRLEILELIDALNSMSE